MRPGKKAPSATLACTFALCKNILIYIRNTLLIDQGILRIMMGTMRFNHPTSYWFLSINYAEQLQNKNNYK